MFGFKPVKTEFFDLFEELAEQTVAAAAILQQMLAEGDDLEGRAQEIKRLENAGDDHVHAVMKLLHESFITPLERGDIRRLVHVMDAVLDSINAAAGRLVLYKINVIRPEALPLAHSLADAAKAVGRLVPLLRRLDQRQTFLNHCIEINTLENQGDQHYRVALAALFSEGADPLEVIKWKEIYEFIEKGIDACEDVADMAEGILLENG